MIQNISKTSDCPENCKGTSVQNYTSKTDVFFKSEIRVWSIKATEQCISIQLRLKSHTY